MAAPLGQFWTSRRLILAATALVIFPTAASAQLQAEPDESNPIRYRSSPGVSVTRDVVFARYDGRHLQLDLYEPRGKRTQRPAIVVISGGGWTAPGRVQPGLIAAALAERGVIAAAIEYRTARELPFPAAVQDLKAAVRWLRANAGRYCADPEAIAVMGGSSGGHVALLAALSHGVAGFEGGGGHNNVSSRAQAVIAMAAPSDLARLTPPGISTAERFLGVPLARDRARWVHASPISHVDRGDPRVFLLHSAIDRAVPIAQTVKLSQRLREVGRDPQVQIYPNAPHAFWMYQPWHAQSMDEAAKFLHDLPEHPARQTSCRESRGAEPEMARTG
jgi:acetyl esterase/lipase